MSKVISREDYLNTGVQLYGDDPSILRDIASWIDRLDAIVDEDDDAIQADLRRIASNIERIDALPDLSAQFTALGERARRFGFEVIMAIVPRDIKKGEYLRVAAPLTDTGNDLGKSLDVLENNIATAEMFAR